MIERAAMFTPEQVQVVGDVIVLLVLMNAGSILTNTLGFMLRNFKMRRDLNEAFRRLKKLENDFNNTSQEGKK